MTGEQVWLRWVREGSAYTITKSRREKVRRERLRAVTLFLGYAVLLDEARRTTVPFRNSDIKRYEKTLEEYGFKNIKALGFSLIYSIELNDFDYNTEKRLSYIYDIISSVYFYEDSRGCIEMWEMNRNLISKAAKDWNAADAGAIVRKAFKDIEEELIREARRHE